MISNLSYLFNNPLRTQRIQKFNSTIGFCTHISASIFSEQTKKKKKRKINFFQDPYRGILPCISLLKYQMYHINYYAMLHEYTVNFPCPIK